MGGLIDGGESRAVLVRLVCGGTRRHFKLKLPATTRVFLTLRLLNIPTCELTHVAAPRRVSCGTLAHLASLAYQPHWWFNCGRSCQTPLCTGGLRFRGGFGGLGVASRVRVIGRGAKGWSIASPAHTRVAVERRESLLSTTSHKPRSTYTPDFLLPLR